MKIRTNIKNPSAALNATLNLLIWRCMKIRTNMKTYSAALNGTLNLRIWGPKDTWKSEPKWKTIQLLLMRLRICKSCWSKDTWKSAQKWKTIQLLLMKLKIHESCWSKDTRKTSTKMKSKIICESLFWALSRKLPQYFTKPDIWHLGLNLDVSRSF